MTLKQITGGKPCFKEEVIENITQTCMYQLDRHRLNIQVLTESPSGTADHPSVVASVEAEVKQMAKLMGVMGAISYLNNGGIIEFEPE